MLVPRVYMFRNDEKFNEISDLLSSTGRFEKRVIAHDQHPVVSQRRDSTMGGCQA